MHGEHEHAHRFEIELFGNVAHGEKIAKRLAHLLVVDVDVAVVHPIARKRLARRGFRLGNLILMVRENQILATGVDVERLAENGHAHGAALDMPAGTAPAPGRIPCGFAGLFALPEGKVERVALLLCRIDARAVFKVVDVLSGELAIARKAAHGKIHVSIVRRIRMTAVDQLLHERDDLTNVLRRARVGAGPFDAQCVGIAIVFRDKAFAKLRDGRPFFMGAADHFIVDVGKVLYERHLKTFILEVPAQRVEHNERPRVANVEIVVNRGTAGVHADLPRYQRYQLFLFAGHGVINLHLTFLHS